MTDNVAQFLDDDDFMDLMFSETTVVEPTIVKKTLTRASLKAFAKTNQLTGPYKDLRKGTKAEWKKTIEEQLKKLPSNRSLRALYAKKLKMKASVSFEDISNNPQAPGVIADVFLKAQKKEQLLNSYNDTFSLDVTTDVKDSFRGIVSVSMEFSYDDDQSVIRERPLLITESKTKKQIIDKVRTFVDSYKNGMTSSLQLSRVTIIYGTQSEEIANINDMVIKNVSFVKLDKPIDANNHIIDNHCVRDFFPDCCPNTPVTVGLFQDYLQASKQSYNMYSQFNSHKPLFSWKSKSKRAYKNFIVANEHLYQITRNELAAMKKPSKSDIDLEDVRVFEPLDFESKIAKKIRVNMKEKTVTSYISDNVLYAPELTVKCYKMYKKITPEYKIDQGFTINSLLHKMFEPVRSTFCHWLKAPRAINTSIAHTGPGAKTIDANKSFSCAIMDLEYVPIFNARTKIVKYDGNLKMTNFYNVRSNDRLFGVSGWVSGYRLKNIEYTCTEMIVPELKHNPLRKIIREMLITDPQAAKLAINIFIGQLQGIPTSHNTQVMSILSKHEKSLCTTDIIPWVDGTYLSISKTENKKWNIKGSIPFAHYIIDLASVTVQDKYFSLIKSGHLLELYQIKTDGIKYRGEFPSGLNPDFRVSRWKKEGSKPSRTYFDYSESDAIDHISAIPSVCIHDINLDRLATTDCIYLNNKAGRGKSTYVISETKDAIKDTLIICSQKAPLVAYSKLGYTVKTISSLMINSSPMRSYKTIIHEEAGLTTEAQYEWLYANTQFNCKMIAIGDGNQLNPVGDDSNPFHTYSIQSMFNIKAFLPFNRRNTFTDEQYDEMITDPTSYKIPDEFCNGIRSSDGWSICYMNATRMEINKQYLRLYNQDNPGMLKKVGKRFMGIGMRMEADLPLTAPKIKHVCNKQLFIIKKITKGIDRGSTITMVDEESRLDEIVVKESNMIYFRYGMCLTLYGIQGRGIPKDLLSIHDREFIKKVPGGLYTAMSRIKETIVQKTYIKQYNEYDNMF